MDDAGEVVPAEASEASARVANAGTAVPNAMSDKRRTSGMGWIKKDNVIDE